jgi:hypothetical protein
MITFPCKTRQSKAIEGLFVTFSTLHGAPYRTFSIAGRQVSYTVTADGAIPSGSGHRMAPHIARHCREFAAALADKMEVAA